MSLPWETSSCIRANQSALSPECCTLSGEATNANFIVFGLTLPGLEPTNPRREHNNQYTTDVI